MLRFLDPRSDFRVLQHLFDTMLGPPKNEKSLKIKFCLKNVSYWLLGTKIGGVNSIHFFDLTLSFWCRAKKCFRSLFFIWLNSAISQNVKHIFEKKKFYVILQTNFDILSMKNFENCHFEKLDFFHLPAHCAMVMLLINL